MMARRAASRWSRLPIVVLAWLACSEVPVPRGSRVPEAPGTLSSRAATPGGTALPRGEPPQTLMRPPPPDYEQADLDADNDLLVAPPAPLEGCEERLERSRISFRQAELPFRKEKSRRAGRAEVVSCGAEQVVVYLGSSAGIKYNTPPTLTCRLALALARFESIAQEQAERHLGQRIARFKHLGTYSCRKMVRFDFISEHSYANAIDIAEVVLERGQVLSVKKHFGALGPPPATREAVFLRSLATRAFDERVFSTVLTPYWDNLHADHFHLDLARYRVDGTRAE
jgi:hypothetical protein